MSAKSRVSIASGAGGPSLLDWSTLESGIKAAQSEENNRSEALTRFFLVKKFLLASSEADDCITDGGNDFGVDAIYIDYEEKHIHLVNTKCISDFSKAKNNFPSSEVIKVRSAVQYLLEKNESLIEYGNPLLAARVAAAWDALEQNVFRITVHLVSNQAPLEKNAERDAEAGFRDYEIALVQHNLTSLANSFFRGIRRKKTRRLKFIDNQYFVVSDIGYQGLQGNINLIEIVESLLDDPENPGVLDASLFEHNVRLELPTTNSINRGIRNTIRARPWEFWALNNGITIVCDQIVTQSRDRNFPVELVNPQIINGCQSAAQIYRTWRESGRHIPQGHVFVKVIQTDDEDLARRIAVATNSQNRIGGQDIRANDDIQIKLAEALKAEGYHYLRKRGELSGATESQTIEMFRSGQLLLAYEKELPVKARTNSNEIFESLYEEVFHPHIVTPGKLIFLHKMHKLLEVRKRYAAHKLRSVEKSPFSEEWILEGSLHVLYAAKLICNAEGANPYEFDQAVARLDEAIKVVSSCFTQSKSAAYRFFRSAHSAQKIADHINGIKGVDTPDRRQMSLPLPEVRKPFGG